PLVVQREDAALLVAHPAEPLVHEDAERGRLAGELPQHRRPFGPGRLAGHRPARHGALLALPLDGLLVALASLLVELLLGLGPRRLGRGVGLRAGLPGIADAAVADRDLLALDRHLVELVRAAPLLGQLQVGLLLCGHDALVLGWYPPQ